jgi:hypothetical protein
MKPADGISPTWCFLSVSCARNLASIREERVVSMLTNRATCVGIWEVLVGRRPIGGELECRGPDGHPSDTMCLHSPAQHRARKPSHDALPPIGFGKLGPRGCPNQLLRRRRRRQTDRRPYNSDENRCGIVLI